MRVFALLGTANTEPKRMQIALRGGDVCDPFDGEQLNGPPWPTRVLRFYCALPLLPFLCVRLDTLLVIVAAIVGNEIFLGLALGLALTGLVHRFGFYAGWKCYGFDLPNYSNWKGSAYAREIFPGSRALAFTARFFTDGD